MLQVECQPKDSAAGRALQQIINLLRKPFDCCLLIEDRSSNVTGTASCPNSDRGVEKGQVDYEGKGLIKFAQEPIVFFS